MRTEPGFHLSVTVCAQHDGTRLDRFLLDQCPPLSRRRLLELFATGRVRVNGRRAAKGDRVQAGGEVTVEGGVGTGGAQADPDIPLTLLLERDDLVIVDKPAGQPSAPLSPEEHGTLANGLLGRYPEMRAVGYGPLEPGLVHRLDNLTSGIVIAARSGLAFERLRSALRRGLIAKRYLAVVRSEGLAEGGVIDAAIAPDRGDARRVMVCGREPLPRTARPARTEWRVVTRGPQWSLIEVSVSRAVRHQVRAHLAHVDRPLAGDLVYGGEQISTLGNRHALHASYVRWMGDEVVPPFEVTAEAPREMEVLSGG